MEQSIWESEVAKAPEAAQQGMWPEKQGSHSESAPHQANSIAISADDFAGLEAKIQRAVQVVKQERQARAEAEARATKAEEQLHGQSPVVEQLQQDLAALKEEREQVKQRIDGLLKQLDALEL